MALFNVHVEPVSFPVLGFFLLFLCFKLVDFDGFFEKRRFHNSAMISLTVFAGNVNSLFICKLFEFFDGFWVKFSSQPFFAKKVGVDTVQDRSQACIDNFFEYIVGVAIRTFVGIIKASPSCLAMLS